LLEIDGFYKMWICLSTRYTRVDLHILRVISMNIRNKIIDE